MSSTYLKTVECRRNPRSFSTFYEPQKLRNHKSKPSQSSVTMETEVEKLDRPKSQRDTNQMLRVRVFGEYDGTQI